MERYSNYFLEKLSGTGCNSFILIPVDIRDSQELVGEMFSALWENADPSQLQVSAGKSLDFLVLKYLLGKSLKKSS